MPTYNFDDVENKKNKTITDLTTLSTNSMIAVADIFARAKKQMNVYEYKTFIFALAQVKWTEENQSNIIYCDKKELADYCGVHSDPDHLSQDLKDKIWQLPRNSFIEISNEDLDYFESGCFISRVAMLKNQVRIKFDDEYFSLFTKLQHGEYITLWADDFLQMDNSENGVRAMTLYEDLRQHSDTRITNERGYGIKAFKEMWNIPKDGKGSYMNQDGHFNRPMFEQKVLEPVLENLAKCKMINLITQDDGKLYKKAKSGNKVLGYVLNWTVSDRPGVATAKEVKEIGEAITKDPQVLKVAKDIVNGKKAATKKNKFNNFPQRSYDYAELEKTLLGNNKKEE